MNVLPALIANSTRTTPPKLVTAFCTIASPIPELLRRTAGLLSGDNDILGPLIGDTGDGSQHTMDAV